MSIARATLFGIGVLAVHLSFAVVSVYVFDRHQPGWEKGLPLLALAWIFAMVALAGGLGCAVGLKVLSRTASPWVALGAGAAVGMVLALALSAGDRFVADASGRELLASLASFWVSLAAVLLFPRVPDDRGDE